MRTPWDKRPAPPFPATQIVAPLTTMPGMTHRTIAVTALGPNGQQLLSALFTGITRSAQ